MRAAALLPIALWMWLAMMLTHEFGHVFAAYATGGRVVSLELRPGYLSHTLVRPNPRPSLVLGSGFLVGWIAPQLTAPLWRLRSWMVGLVLRCWAAFCLLAGGCYLAVAGGERLTDTGQLVAEGWPLWLLVSAGVAVAAIGYARSRSAWIMLARELETSPIGWRTAACWWLLLTAWTAGQWGLHTAVAPPG